MAGTPEDVEGLRQALADARAEAAAAKALASSTEAVIAALKLEILKLRRELYGQRSERRARLLAQMELQLEELEATASEDELAAEQAAARTSTTVRAFERRRPRRKPFPEHLPRERVVIEAPPTCVCCGSGRIAKLGEDVTETLEVIPRQWKVIQTVRERFSCRACETITQPPAPFHTIPRAWAGLLAMVLFEKAPAAEPAVRALRPRGRQDQPVHPGRPGRRLRRRAEALADADRGSCHGGRASARR
jgi:transposase